MFHTAITYLFLEDQNLPYIVLLYIIVIWKVLLRQPIANNMEVECLWKQRL